MASYKATIGIETHVQLKTKTKLFSSVDNDASNAKPNTLISHIDVGMPGALPVLNEKAIELACRAAYALNTKPQEFSKFDRKHYFYPDLPKGYQITQYDQPIIKGGYLEIVVDGKPKQIGITRAHLEEDAGKNIHPAGADYTLVDLNRAGTPLLEIVSEPDIASPPEAKAYARELYLLMKYAGVSDVDLYLGHMRFDVNVSVSNSAKPGIRTETKNLNSFRSVEAAVAYEIKRQTEELEKGHEIIQETRGWDESKQKTISQRSKEEAHDYRYMPEPDIPPIELDEEFVKRTQSKMPKLPSDYRKILKELDIDDQVVEDALSVPDIASAIVEIKDKAGASHARRICFWLHWKTGMFQEEGNIKPAPVASLMSVERMIKLSQLVEDGMLNSTAAKDVFYEMIADKDDPEEIAKKMKLLQVSDESAIEDIVSRVISDNPKVAEDIKAGQEKAIGFLVGQVMATSKGAANPSLAQKIIKQKLGI